MLLLMAYLLREIGAERSGQLLLAYRLGVRGKRVLYACALYCYMHAFTKKGKGKLIHVKLRLERKERTAGVLLARLLRGARNDRGVLFLGFGTNS